MNWIALPGLRVILLAAKKWRASDDASITRICLASLDSNNILEELLAHHGRGSNTGSLLS